MSLKLKLLLWVNNLIYKLDFDKITVEGFRDFADNRDLAILDGKPIQLPHVKDIACEGRNGIIPMRLYTPENAENAPVIVFYHGGGFVIGNLKSHDKVCRRLCEMNKAFVVAIDYRLAPEHKFPAAPEDCYDATKWVAENIAEYGGNPEKLVVCGDSAGGNLAAVTAIQARDLGTPKIAAQILVYPMVEARMLHPSINENAIGYILTKDMMTWFTNNYVRDESDKVNPLMSPILTPDLSNLPPALIQTAGFDPLRDEGIEYAQKLKAAGNQVKHTNYEGLVHTYFTMPDFSKKCLSAHQEIADELSLIFEELPILHT